MQSQITKLKNGLRIMTATFPHLESVSLGIWVKTGSAYEQVKQNGISHFLEHMSFKGTKTRTALELSEAIENVGGQSNAYTSREFTAYYAKMLKKDMALGVDVIVDSLLNSTFPEEELQKEREVVVQEIKQTIDSPDDIVFDYFQEAAFPEQAIGRPILGSVETVRSFQRETLENYLQNNYAAENMVACAVGNIRHEDFVQLIEDKMSGFRPHTLFTPDSQHYEGGVFIKERKIEQAHVVLGFEGNRYETENYYKTLMLANLLGGSSSSRLFQEVREKRGLAYAVSSFAACHSQTGLFAIYAGTDADDVKKLVPVLCDEIRKLRDEPALEKELTRIKHQLGAGLLMAMESPSSTVEMLARQQLIYNRTIPSSEMMERIESVSLSDLRQRAEEIFSTNPTYTLLGAVQQRVEFDELKQMLK